MARFSLRPLLHRWSTRHSLSIVASDDTQEDDRKDSDCHHRDHANYDHDGRRTISTTDTAPISPTSSPRTTTALAFPPRKSSLPTKLRDHFLTNTHHRDEPKQDLVDHSRLSPTEPVVHHPDSVLSSSSTSDSLRKDSYPSDVVDDLSSDRPSSELQVISNPPETQQPAVDVHDVKLDEDTPQLNPVLVVEAPTPAGSPEYDVPNPLSPGPSTQHISLAPSLAALEVPDSDQLEPASPEQGSLSSPSISPFPDLSGHYQDSVKSANAIPITAASEPSITTTSLSLDVLTETPSEYFASSDVSSMAQVLYRKIWVKRPNASPTLIQIKEDDLVDDVRDLILRKYANSLGKTFDAPDMTLRIVARSEHAGAGSERLLGPEESMCRTLDKYYAGGQTVDDALIIDVPQKRTPKPSPRPYQHLAYHTLDEFRPHENGTDYFPPMQAMIQPTLPANISRDHHHSIVAADHPRSISVLNTGQVPPLPSPGGGRRHREHRPKIGRQHTSSPTIMAHTNNVGAVVVPVAGAPGPHLPHRQTTNRPRMDSGASDAHHPNAVPPPPPLPSPPAPEAPPTGKNGSTPPTPSSAIPGSPHTHRLSRARKGRRSTPDKLANKSRSPQPSVDMHGNVVLPSISSILDGSVPPINVLIVEDNSINLRILEGLMKRLKVRWQTAMNGQIAVEKWRAGGFHLVLMDIQMPIMNGLQATKEIRRLERVNGIGVFSSQPGTPLENGHDVNGDDAATEPNKSQKEADDRLATSEGLFKSPIIIVALTASSLQSDRHEALAAGCNDFLTKPVSFVWLERKVKEWGCMQALIDFDGWRKWKDYAVKEEAAKTGEEREKEREKEERMAKKMAILQEKQRKRKEEEEQQRREKEEEQQRRDKEKELESQRSSLEPNAWAVAASSSSPSTAESSGPGEENGDAVPAE